MEGWSESRPAWRENRRGPHFQRSAPKSREERSCKKERGLFRLIPFYFVRPKAASSSHAALVITGFELVHLFKCRRKGPLFGLPDLL
jgi:hypothetical protein